VIALALVFELPILPVMQKSSIIFLDSSILFERLNAVLAEQSAISLPGNISIESMIMKGNDTWLFAEAEVKGPYNGKVILQCKPAFNNETKRFSLQEMNIELAEDNFLAKLAGKFVNNMFTDKADNKLEDVVNEKFMAILQEILGQMSDLQLPKGGVLKFNTESFNLHELHTDSEGLHFIAELTGEASLEY